ncbi:hypothetical protein H4S08_000017 [Coemansia sp. RSA 1365]|nr:hypothetical protein H4S08_000017 [Coemansia sp. RSA 1365]
MTASMRVVVNLWRAQPVILARAMHASAPRDTILSQIQHALTQARPKRASPSERIKQATADVADQQRGSPEINNRQESQTKKQMQGQGANQAEQVLLPQEDCAAGAMLRMPKTFGQIEQPEDAEVAKIVLVGAANAGKSTLINRLVGDDVTIVSARPQTTRTRIMASLTMGRRQLLFLDTPGIVSRKALRRVERGVVTSPWRTLSEADCAVLLLDAYKLTQKTDEVEKYLFAELPKTTNIPALLVVNKIDQVEDQPKLLETVRKYQAMYKGIVGEPMYISALGNVGVDELRLQLLASTRPGNWEFPANVKSDLSDLTRVEDLIRAEWFARLTGYMPYVVRQRNVGWKYVAAPVAKPIESLVPETGAAGFEGKVVEIEYGAAKAETEPKADAETKAELVTESSAKVGSEIDKKQDIPLRSKRPRRPMLDIKQELLVSSGGEAKILLGAKGALLKEIALAANRTISKALGCRVRLHLQVVVVEDRRTRK